MQDYALPIILVLLGAGGLGSVLISRLVPQRLSPDEKKEQANKALLAIEEKLEEAAKGNVDRDAIIALQADYIQVLRSLLDPPPPWPEHLTRR